MTKSRANLTQSQANLILHEYFGSTFKDGSQRILSPATIRDIIANMSAVVFSFCTLYNPYYDYKRDFVVRQLFDLFAKICENVLRCL